MSIIVSILAMSTFITDAQQIMSSASFNSRGWVYNTAKIFKENEAEMPTLDDTESVLGIQLNYKKRRFVTLLPYYKTHGN